MEEKVKVGDRIPKTELFVIVADWFDNPYDDIVFTSFEDAKLAVKDVEMGRVLNIYDFADHEYHKGKY